MKRVYHLSKAIATLPCLGMVPLGIYLMCLASLRFDFGVAALILAAMIIYIPYIYHFAGMYINPIDFKLAENPQKFVFATSIVTMTFSAVTLVIGMCLWPVLSMLFKWFLNDLLNMDLSGQAEFFWIYFLANSFFQIMYLVLWAFAEKSLLIRRLTLPHACW